MIIANEVLTAANIKSENPAIQYKVINQIGRGGFSKIFKVLKQSDNLHYALKFTSPENEQAK